MDKIPTPTYSHLSPGDFEHVYEPAEDSFLMLDALEQELTEIRNSKPAICLEIGSGSGILSTGLASVLKECCFLATDVNAKACQASERTAKANQTTVQVVRTNCVSGLETRLRSKVDILLCNPPYVCTSEEETKTCDIYASWAGGEQGRNLTDLVIRQLPTLLSKSGRAYIVIEQRNNFQAIQALLEELDLCHDVIITRKAGIELLSILKVWL